MRETLRTLTLLVVFLSLTLSTAGAQIGRLQTKRERASHLASSEPPTPRARYEPSGYAAIRESFLNEDYPNTAALADRYVSQNPHAPDAGDALYLEALSLIKLDRLEEAREAWASLERSAPDVELKAVASASIGDSYYYEGNRTRAYESYKETVRKYPVSDQKDYLRERLLELSSELGYTTVRPSPANASSAARLRQMSIDQAPFYAVQVGSFSKPKNARQLVDKLIRQGYEAYAAADKSGGMTRVRVGRFSSKHEAVEAERGLRREGYPTKIVP